MLQTSSGGKLRNSNFARSCSLKEKQLELLYFSAMKEVFISHLSKTVVISRWLISSKISLIFKPALHSNHACMTTFSSEHTPLSYFHQCSIASTVRSEVNHRSTSQLSERKYLSFHTQPYKDILNGQRLRVVTIQPVKVQHYLNAYS